MNINVIFRKRKFNSLICMAVIGFQLLVFSSWSQTFGGGNGTPSEPYKISTPEHLVELSTYTNSSVGTVTAGKYFVMTQNIDMASVSNFSPIGKRIGSTGNNYRYFCGNFDGGGFSIKNLTIIISEQISMQHLALFGETKGATISNLTLDKAFISDTTIKATSIVSAFVGNTNFDSLYIDNCRVVNCILKSNANIYGFVAYMYGGHIDNCHIINTKMEGYGVTGFCGTIGSGQISNSSVSNSLLTSIGNSTIGFVGGGGFLSNCGVYNCTLSGQGTISGFGGTFSEGEVSNCYAQALLIRTQASQFYASVGFISILGTVGGEGHTPKPMLVSNCYAACEFKSIDNYHGKDYAFGAGGGLLNVTVSNSYYKTDTNLAGGVHAGSGAIGKSEIELKDVNIVAYPGLQDNSLNYGQSSAAWKQDLSPSINKGYPILSWQKHVSYVSTYYPANLTEYSATLQGFAFTNGEPIAEHGFQWREKGTSSWTKVIVTDTTFNISYALAGLAKNTTYEYYVYMQTATLQRGDTVEFTTYGEHTVSGKVTFNSSPLAGVSISCSGQPNATTNAQGEYSFIVPSLSSVTLTPSLSGYSFTPSVRNLSNIVTDQPNQDFVAKTVGIAVTANEIGIKIYPNPTDGKITIRNEESEVRNVEIYDIVGLNVGADLRVCPEQQGEHAGSPQQIKIDISHLANGIYFLKVNNKTYKIIKN